MLAGVAFPEKMIIVWTLMLRVVVVTRSLRNGGMTKDYGAWHPGGSSQSGPESCKENMESRKIIVRPHA